MHTHTHATDPFPLFGKTDSLALDVRTNTGSVWDDAHGVTGDTFRGYDLGLSLMVVPPHTTVGLVTSMQIQRYAGKDSGIVQANFSDGSYMVGSPGVLVAVVS